MTKDAEASDRRLPVLDRRSVLAAGAGVALFGAAALAAQKAASGPQANLRAPDDLIWGVNGHPITAYRGLSFEGQLDLVKKLGFTQYRVNLRGDGPPHALDELISAAEKKGIQILPIVQLEMDLAKEQTDSLYKEAFNLAKKMVTRYRDRVRIWELGNEMENFAILQPCEMRDDGTQYPCEWGHAGGVGKLEYYGPRWKKVSAVLKGFSDGAIAADKRAIRAIGTAGWGHLGAFERMVEDGIKWEITIWHDYQTVTEEYLHKLASYGKPIWITEFNAGGGGEKSPEENAAMLTERMAYYREMREKYDVAAAFQYELYDEPYWGDTFEARQGLVKLEPAEHGNWREGEWKPAAYAVQKALTSPPR